MKMDKCHPKRNILNIKPFRARDGYDERSPEAGPSKKAAFPAVNGTAKDSADLGLSGSTPKRNYDLSAESSKTPNDKPVVLEEEFSPIELFPFSQTQSVPIVQWNYNAVQRTTRPGSLRRSRQSSGLLPSPEIRPPKRRTPSPTVEDMPPFKKSSQEYNTLEAHLHDLQALDSDCKDSDDEELEGVKKETDEERLGNSMHQSLHISDKFERTDSPDIFDSAPDDLFEPPVATLDPRASSVSPPPSSNELVATVPKEHTQSSPQEMSFEIDDSFAECLIACTEKVETEVRLSQQQKEPLKPKSVAAAPAIKNITKKPSPKKAPKDLNSSLQRGRLQVVTVTSPKKQSLSPNVSKKPVAGPSKKSDGTEFSPKWMENIKNATSPMNSSFKASQNGEKNIHRTLFSTPKGKKASPSAFVQNGGTKMSPANGDLLNKSIDPFEDSFEPNLEDLCAAEQMALSQLASTQRVADPKLAPPAPSNPPVIKPAQQQAPMRPPPAKQFQRFPSASVINRPAAQANVKQATSTFPRHMSTPLFNKPAVITPQPQAQKTQLPPAKPFAKPAQMLKPQPPPLKPQNFANKPPIQNWKPQVPTAKTCAPTNNSVKQPPSVPKPMPPSRPLSQTVKPQAPVHISKPQIPVQIVQKNPMPPSGVPKAFGSDPPTTAKPSIINHLKSSPLVRHKSADVLGKKAPPVAASTVMTAKLGGLPISRHRSAEFGQGQPLSQKCSQQEIERKRLEAKKRLAMRKLNGKSNSNNT